MSAAPPGFSAQLWHHLEQPLRNLCTAWGRAVAADVADYSEVYCRIVHYASKRGACFLARGDRQALEDWISTNLLDEIVQADHGGWGQWLGHLHQITSIPSDEGPMHA